MINIRVGKSPELTFLSLFRSVKLLFIEHFPSSHGHHVNLGVIFWVLTHTGVIFAQLGVDDLVT